MYFIDFIDFIDFDLIPTMDIFVHTIIKNPAYEKIDN